MTTMKIGSFWQERLERRRATTSSTKGYEPGDARAEVILRTGEDPIPGPIPRHAQLEDLQKLGFEILNPDPNCRSVRRDGRTFLEGHLESMVAKARDDVHEATGKGRPWGTSRRREN